jgi:hypothetical protein
MPLQEKILQGPRYFLISRICYAVRNTLTEGEKQIVYFTILVNVALGPRSLIFLIQTSTREAQVGHGALECLDDIVVLFGVDLHFRLSGLVCVSSENDISAHPVPLQEKILQ